MTPILEREHDDKLVEAKTNGRKVTKPENFRKPEIDRKITGNRDMNVKFWSHHSFCLFSLLRSTNELLASFLSKMFNHQIVGTGTNK